MIKIFTHCFILGGSSKPPEAPLDPPQLCVINVMSTKDYVIGGVVALRFASPLASSSRNSDQ